MDTTNPKENYIKSVINSKERFRTLAIGIVIFVIMGVMMVSDPVRQPLADIREDILALTPIGTSIEDVLMFIDEDGRNHFRLMRVRAVEETSIVANIGATGRGVMVGRPQYINGQWQFDENGKLIDFILWRGSRQDRSPPT